MHFYLNLSQNINSATRHLKFCYISIFYKFSVDSQWNKNLYTTGSFRLCIKPGIQNGMECGERGECYIPGNVAKLSVEYPQIFRGISPIIPGNVAKLLSLISESFTVHYVLISSNQSEYLYTFPVCKNVLLANPKETF